MILRIDERDIELAPTRLLMALAYCPELRARECGPISAQSCGTREVTKRRQEGRLEAPLPVIVRMAGRNSSVLELRSDDASSQCQITALALYEEKLRTLQFSVRLEFDLSVGEAPI